MWVPIKFSRSSMPSFCLQKRKKPSGSFHICQQNISHDHLRFGQNLVCRSQRFSSGDESSETGNERFSGEIGNKFQVNCLYTDIDTKTHMISGWLVYVRNPVWDTMDLQNPVQRVRIPHLVWYVREEAVPSSEVLFWVFDILQITHFRSIEQIALCPPIMWKLQNKENTRRRMCSERITVWLEICEDFNLANWRTSY